MQIEGTMLRFVRDDEDERVLVDVREDDDGPTEEVSEREPELRSA